MVGLRSRDLSGIRSEVRTAHENVFGQYYSTVPFDLDLKTAVGKEAASEDQSLTPRGFNTQ